MTFDLTDVVAMPERERKAWLFEALTRVARKHAFREVELDPNLQTAVEDRPGLYDDIPGTFRLRQDGFELDALAYLIAYHLLKQKHADLMAEKLVARAAMQASRLVLSSVNLDLGLRDPPRGPLGKRRAIRAEARWAAEAIIAAIHTAS